MIESAITASAEIKSWLAAADARLASALAAEVSFPEKTIADCTRSSLNDAAKAKERADTLGKVPGFADALDEAAVTAGHVDAITSKAKPLTDDQRAEYFERVAGLVDVASAATVEEFRRRLALEAGRPNATTGSTVWSVSAARRRCGCGPMVRACGGSTAASTRSPAPGSTPGSKPPCKPCSPKQTPESCPSDPVLKQQHLRALAFQRLVLEGGAGVGQPGRPEMIVVVDADAPNGAGGPTVDWGIPVELPDRVLAEMCGDADLHAVVVRNGVILHAPGELDLGRTTRLANRAQRRALRALYSTCAIPGCAVRYSRCKLHHIIWWRNGGRTDLANLLPICTHHHTKVHDHGWNLQFGPNRELTISFPDGTIHNTGPPNRRAA